MADGDGGGVPWPVWVVVTLGVALIGAYATIAASGRIDGGSGDDNGAGPVGPDSATFTVSVPASDAQADITVAIEGTEIGRIYPHQEPHEISTSQFAEGDHTYYLQAIQYAPDGSSSRTLTGSGTISVEDGKEFQVFTNLNEGTLYLQPMT
jgi:hypothetical protein